MLVDTISLELFSNTENWKGQGEIFLHGWFWMLHNFDIRHREFLFSTQPYRLQENRFVWVKRGWASYSFNLVDYVFRAGDLVVFYADTLVEKKEHSEDFEFDAFCYDSRLSKYNDHDETKERPSFIRLVLTDVTMPIVEQHFKLLWDMVHQEPFSQDNVNLLTRSLLIYVDRQHGQAMMNRPTNRQQETMRRFLSLVSLHAAKERNIPFYAEKLCIAPHYLSTLVKQESDRTVMQWINQTAVKEIKVWLAYSDESIAQISERLLFPCPASLTKFFKRETGMTPGQYRALGIQA